MFGQRLEHALKSAAKSRKWLATQIGTTESAITMVINGQAKSMNAANTARSAKALGVSSLWLATGEGEMVDTDSLVWRDVARKLATTMDAAERGQRYALFVQEVDAIVERAKLSTQADQPTAVKH